jgi:hypothetical protein
MGTADYDWQKDICTGTKTVKREVKEILIEQWVRRVSN